MEGNQLLHLLEPLAFKLDLTETLGGLTTAAAVGERVRDGQGLLEGLGEALDVGRVEAYGLS